MDLVEVLDVPDGDGSASRASWIVDLRVRDCQAVVDSSWFEGGGGCALERADVHCDEFVAVELGGGVGVEIRVEELAVDGPSARGVS